MKGFCLPSEMKSSRQWWLNTMQSSSSLRETKSQEQYVLPIADLTGLGYSYQCRIFAVMNFALYNDVVLQAPQREVVQ